MGDARDAQTRLSSKCPELSDLLLKMKAKGLGNLLRMAGGLG